MAKGQTKATDAIIKTAKEWGFDTAEFLCGWRGFNVFAPCCDDGIPLIIGMPVFILQDDVQTRIAEESELEMMYKEIDFSDVDKTFAGRIRH